MNNNITVPAKFGVKTDKLVIAKLMDPRNYHTMNLIFERNGNIHVTFQ